MLLTNNTVHSATSSQHTTSYNVSMSQVLNNISIDIHNNNRNFSMFVILPCLPSHEQIYNVCYNFVQVCWELLPTYTLTINYSYFVQLFVICVSDNNNSTPIWYCYHYSYLPGADSVIYIQFFSIHIIHLPFVFLFVSL